jgi:hypothetical protein
MTRNPNYDESRNVVYTRGETYSEDNDLIVAMNEVALATNVAENESLRPAT